MPLYRPAAPSSSSTGQPVDRVPAIPGPDASSHLIRQTQNFQRQNDAAIEQDAAQQQREADRAARDQLKAQTAATNAQRLAEFNSQGRPHYISPDTGLVEPKQPDEQWQAEQQALQQTADQYAQWQNEGRPTFIDRVTRQPRPVHTDEQWAALKKEKEAKDRAQARAQQFDAQIKAHDAQTNYDELTGQRKPLTADERRRHQRTLADASREAVTRLVPRLTEAARQVSGGNDWIPFNENPTPEAEAARQRAADLQKRQIETSDLKTPVPLNEQDLADLETHAPDVAGKLRAAQDALAKDQENQAWKTQRETQKAELQLRRDNPDAWEQLQRQRIATAPDAQSTARELTDRLRSTAEAHRAQTAEYENQAGKRTAQLQRIQLDNQEAVQRGLPADQAVRASDGSIWSRTHWDRYTQAAQELDAWQKTSAPARTALDSSAQDLQQEARLAEEAHTVARQRQQQERTAELQKMAAEGHGDLAQQISALDADAEARLADLHEMHPDGAPPEALQALQQDITARYAEVQATQQQRQQAGQDLYASLRQYNRQVDWADPKQTDAAFVKTEAKKRGLTPEQATAAIATQRAADWTLPYAGKTTTDLKAAPLIRDFWQAVTQDTTAGTGTPSEPYRLLPDGTATINPALALDKNAWNQAIAAADKERPQTAATKTALEQRRVQMLTDAGARAWPLLSSTPDYQQWVDARTKKEPGFANLSVDQQAATYLDEGKGKQSWIAKLGANVWRGLVDGLVGLGNTVIGLGAAATGNEWLARRMEAASTYSEFRNQQMQALGKVSDPVLGGVNALLNTTVQLALPITGGALGQAGGRVIAALGEARNASGFLNALRAGAGSAKVVSAAALTGGSVAGGAQTFAQVYGQAYQTALDGGASAETARRQAMMPATLAGMGTLILAGLQGLNGVQSVFRGELGENLASALKPATLKNLALIKKDGLAALSNPAVRAATLDATRALLGHMGKEGFGGWKSEAFNEALDQIQQGIVAKATYEPDKAPGAILAEAMQAGLLGGIAGAGVSGLSGTVELGQEAGQAVATLTPYHRRPEAQTLANAAITNFEPPNLSPEQVKQTRLVASSLLAVAQNSTDLLQDNELAAIGLERGKDGTLATLPQSADGKPPRVKVDAQGNPIITQPTLDALETQLPAVRAAIGMNEQEATDYFATAAEPTKPGTAGGAVSATPSADLSAETGKSMAPPAGGQGINNKTGTTQAGGVAAPPAATTTSLAQQVRDKTLSQVDAARQIIARDPKATAEAHAASLQSELSINDKQARNLLETIGITPAPAAATASQPSLPAAKTGTPVASLLDNPDYVEGQRKALSAVPPNQRRALKTLFADLDQQLTRYAHVFPGGIIIHSGKPDAPSLAGGAGLSIDVDTRALSLDLGTIGRVFSNPDNRINLRDLRTAFQEEMVHSAQLDLRKRHPEHSESALAAKWSRLPDDLRQRVWKSYHAYDIADKRKPAEPPADLSVTLQANMWDEFGRMLVQDETFQSVSEQTMADNPALRKDIIAYLRNLIAELTRLIKRAPRDMQHEISEYKARVVKTLQALLKQAPSATATASTLAKQQAQTENLAQAGGGKSVVSRPSGAIPNAAPKPLSGTAGRETTAYTDNNDAITTRWHVAEVDDLVISNDDTGKINPEYPAMLQPRDRTSAGSEAQVQDIATNANLDRLSHSPSVGDGAPIVSPADSVVESGNGRLMGLRRAYASALPSASTYRDALIRRAAEFGLDPAAIQGMKHPVLVRQRTTEVDRSAFVLAANVSTIAPKREVEVAKIDAAQITPDLFDTFTTDEDGDFLNARNHDFIRSFVRDIVPPAERPGIIDSKGSLSQTGQRRIRNALFVYAYGASPEALNTLANLTEATDPRGRNLTNAVVAAAPTFAEQTAREKAGALYPLSIADDIVAALQSWLDARNAGQTIADYLAQDRLPGIDNGPTDLQSRILETLDANAAAPRRLLDIFTRYARAVDHAGDPRQAALFAEEKPTKPVLWRLASDLATERPAMAAPARPAPTAKPMPAAQALRTYRNLGTLLDKGLKLNPGQITALDKARTALSDLFQLDSANTLNAPNRPEADAPPETPEETAALDAQFAASGRVKPQLDAFCQSIADQFNGTAILPDLKGRERALEKGRVDYQGDFTKLKDLARATIECTTLAQAQACVDEITRRSGQTAKRNLFAENPPDGYRDALFNLTFDGVTVELQVHVPEVLAVKNQLHHAYVARETIKRKAQAEDRPLSDNEQKRIDRMNRIMRKFYNQALGLPADQGATADELARRTAGTSSSASSRLTENPRRLLSSSAAMGLGGSSSNAQPLPEASRTTANASFLSDLSGTSKKAVAPGNVEGFITKENTTSAPETQAVRITTRNIREHAGTVDVTALQGRESQWRNAFTAPAGHVLLPLDRLISPKDQSTDPRFVAGLKPDPRQTAASFIARALDQEPGIKHRAPVDVIDNGDGTYTVQDGNATTQALMLAGWTHIPAIVAPRNTLATAARPAPGTQLDLFDLLTPAQQQSKLSQPDLFGGTAYATRPAARPPANRPRAVRPESQSQQPGAATVPAGQLGELFAQPPAQGPGSSRHPAGQPGSQRGSGTGQPGAEPDLFNAGPADTGASEGPGRRRPDPAPPGQRTGPQPRAAEPQRPVVTRPAPGSPSRNFEPPADLSSLAPQGARAKIKANLAAIQLLKQLETEQRDATPDEKRTLSAYTGWGQFKEAFNDAQADERDRWARQPSHYQRYKPDDLISWEKAHGELHDALKAELTEDEYNAAARSTLNAHYTAAPVIRAMWSMVERLGFTGGRALEPSAGVGHYVGLQPAGSAASTQWQTVELDDLSAKLLAKLYPEAAVNEQTGGNPGRILTGLGFERARIPNGSLDLVISNVPFHESGPRKKGFPKLNLHNFFFAHALDKVKPGGLVAFITSASTMQNNQKQRDFIASKGDLVAAFRLPNNAFKENAGTEVVTDILIFRKPDGTAFQGKPWRMLTEVGRQTITLKQKDDQLADDFRAEVKAAGTPLSETRVGDKLTAEVSAPILVNEYFAAHPDHVLGTHSLEGSMYGGNEYTVTAPPGLNVMQALDALTSRLPANIMGKQQAAGATAALADRSDRPFSFVERQGKLYEVQDDGTMIEPDWASDPASVRTFRSWSRVKDITRTLIQLENSTSSTDDQIEDARRTLNIAYDTHVATHGSISKRHGNQHTHLYSDPEYPLTAALENETVTQNAKTGKRVYSYPKATLLRRRVVKPIAPPTQAKDFTEALQFSLAWRGQIDTGFIGGLLGISQEEASALADAAPDVFEDPVSVTYENAETYLAGNVRQKLEQAQEAAENDPRYRKNVDALIKAQPARRSIGAITPTLGARWIPEEVYNAFIKTVLQGNGTVRYIPAGNMFRLSGDGYFKSSEFSTEKMGSYDLLDTLLSLKEPIITWRDREGKTHFDATATAAAKTAASKMKRAFVDFVKTSEVPVTVEDEDGQTQTLPIWQHAENVYNDTQNAYITPQHKGDYLQFPGLSDDVWRTAHRRAVIARFLAERRGMMAHGVGSGKTFNQIILSYELRRMGLAKKPMIVVQNSTLGQFAASYLQAYPAARILVPSERDLQTQNRRKLVSRIATGDYDAVILSHSQFDLISNKPESVRSYMSGAIDELRGLVQAEKRGKKSKVRDLEGMLKRLEDRLASMLDALGERQDSTIYFEDLGVDALIVDEAHNYKSVPIVTRMGRVKGVPASADSQRAIGMMLKTRHVQAKTRGRNVFLATGTPVKNSMAEAYIMVNLVAPDVLEDYKIHNFDDFATSYGQITSSTEISWSGAPKVESRFAKFQNGRELITMVRSVFDVAMGNDKLGLKVPKIKGGAPSLDIVPATPTIDLFNQWVRNVSTDWAQADGKKKEEFTAVPIMTLQAGIVAALDPRLINSAAPDHPESKVNTAIREMLRIYHEGRTRRTTQLVFADLRNPFNMSYLSAFSGDPFPDYKGGPAGFDLYQDIKKKLIAGGVKESEILLMEPGMKKDRRTALFEKVSSGEIAIAIGSTETLGVGVNVQERLKALHHLMPPRDFTPAMHEQRNGRALRQGNLHYDWGEEIEIHQWGTEGSMDSAVYGTLGRKQRFITQLLMGEVDNDVFDDPTDPIAVNLAEMAARTMGDPDFIRRIEVEKELRDLRLESDAFTSELAGRRSRLASFTNTLRNLPGGIESKRQRLTTLANLWTRNPAAPRPEGVRETTDLSDKPIYQFGDSTIDTAAKDSGITKPLDLWLAIESKNLDRRGLRQSLGLPFIVNGIPFSVTVETTIPGSTVGGEVQYQGQFLGRYSGADGLIRLLRTTVPELRTSIDKDEAYLNYVTQQAEQLRTQLEGNPTFPRATELQAMEDELVAVDARLAEKAAPPPKPGEELTEKQRRLVGLPPVRPADPALLTDEVRAALRQAELDDTQLTLPQLDRKLYERVNRALESAGGRWDRKAQAHLFASDPSAALGLTPRNTLSAPARPEAGQINLDAVASQHGRNDPYTGVLSFITGSRLTREQGQVIAQVHAERLRRGLREGKDRGNAGPALAASRSRAFAVPLITQAQLDRLQSLESIGEGTEAIVYADRAQGTVYKVLMGHKGSALLGIYPELFYNDAGQLDYTFDPASRPRHLGIRLAVQSLLGGTPTEIAGIGPNGHIILKQPLSPNAEIGRQDETDGTDRLPSARSNAGLVRIPPRLLSDPEAPPTWLAVVEGRPYLVVDLQADNFVGDNQNAARVNDAVIAQIPDNLIAKVPRLANVIKDATASAARLGDRSNRLFTPSRPSPITAEQDAAYLAAVQSGDMTTAQRMVDEAAKAAGYKKKLFTGQARGLTVIPKVARNELPKAYAFLTNDREVAGHYSGAQTRAGDHHDYGAGRKGQTYRVYAKLDNPLNLDNPIDEQWWTEALADDQGWESILDTMLYLADDDQLAKFAETYQVSRIDEDGDERSDEYVRDDIAWLMRKNPTSSWVKKAKKRAAFRALGFTWENDSYINDDGVTLSASDTLSEALEEAWAAIRDQGFYLQDALSNSPTGQMLVLADDKIADRFLEEGGYDSYRHDDTEVGGTSYIVFSPEQIKRQGITRDAQGNVIQLSQRFNPQSDSILYTPSRPAGSWAYNHLDKAFTTQAGKLKTLITSTQPAQALAQYVGNSKAGTFFSQTLAELRRQFTPLQSMGPEALALYREMHIKSAFGKELAMDVFRSLEGKGKFTDLAYPPGFASNRDAKRDLYLAMTGGKPMDELSPDLQRLAKQLRALLVKAGQEAVAAGRMNQETFANLSGNYLPHYYEQDGQQEAIWTKAARVLGIKDVLAQRTTAWHIVDTETTDPRTGKKGDEGALVNWDDKGTQWRFRSEEHRDAFYADFINDHLYHRLRNRSDQRLRGITREMLDDPKQLLTEYQQGVVREMALAARARFKKRAPLTIEEQEKAGLLMDPVYSVVRYLAQMHHDNAIAEFFGAIARNTAWTTDTPSQGYTQIPDNRRYGKLAGKYVQDTLARQVLETVGDDGQIMELYDDLVRAWSSGKTVWNLGTHVRNVLGNIGFAQLAGVNPLNPANRSYFKTAIHLMRGTEPNARETLREMMEAGVLGADYSSAELKGALRGLLPDPDMMGDKDPPVRFVSKMSRLLIQSLPDKLGRAFAATSAKAHAAYAGADEFFKIAAYLKAKAQGMTTREAADHVRKWFPYYDNIGSSGALKFVRRVHPFFSFFREATRILANAVKERPLSLAGSLLVPYVLTQVSMAMLGLDDERDQAEVLRDMKGKLKGTDSVPVFSILLPWRSQGRLAQFDLTNISPFASWLSSPLDTTGDDAITTAAKQLITASPFGSITYAMAANEDAFNNRPIIQEDMTAGEKAAARASHVANTLLPPLMPFGSSWNTIASATERSTNKTLEKRNLVQALTRALAGIDIRNASPDLYRIAKDYRTAHNIPENVWAGGTTAQQRLRKDLFAALVQDTPNLTRVRNILLKLRESGKPVETQTDINRLLFYRNPVMIMDGKTNQQVFQSTLAPEAGTLLNDALAEFRRIQQTAPLIISQALAQTP